MLRFNYKNWIAENVDLKVAEYTERFNVEPFWDKVIIGYTPADHEDFMKFYASHGCKHPKELYTPGKTVISHFIPISKDLVDQYSQGNITKDEWEKMCKETKQVSRGITDSIIETLQGFGREAALLSERDGWSHLCGAEVAQIGMFENKENMLYSGAQVGWLGSLITEVIID